MKVLLPFIIILICVGMYFLYISPTAMDVKLLSAKKVEYSTVLAKSEELAIDRDAALADIHNISEANVSRLDKIIPATFDSVLFANDLNNMVSQYGMTVRDFRVNEPKTEVRDTIISQPKNQPYKTTVVSFKLNGSYQQFVSFLGSLESSLRLMDISGLNIQTFGNSKPGEVSFEYLVEVNTYSLR